MGDQNDASETPNSSAKYTDLPKEIEALSVSKGKTKKTRNENEGASVFEPTPEKQKVKRENKGTASNAARKIDFSAASTETNDGEWLKGHPWQSTSPDYSLNMAATVCKSAKYTVSEEWENIDEKVDLKEIHKHLPKFIGQMKGPSSRQDLKYLMQKDVINKPDIQTPHLLEIYNKRQKVVPKDESSRPPSTKEKDFKAYSLPKRKKKKGKKNQDQPLEMYYLDCEYMLRIHLPNNSLEWFDVDGESKRITKIKNKDNRWIFIPSFNRAKIALLDWPEDNIVTQDSTIRILVVRPSQFDKYVKSCGHMFPVICLPQDEIGAGYPRFWIQKIALRLKLDFIWMIDDSVECFYEYHPEEKPANGSYKKYRRRPFGRVFERIEDLVKKAQHREKPTAAMSPKRFMGGKKLEKPFVCKPPQIAVFLNLKVLKSKEVNYRPELQVFEDMMFGYECEQNGLKVFMDNRVHSQDHRWSDTGARSPSVQQKLPEPVEDTSEEDTSEEDTSEEDTSEEDTKEEDTSEEDTLEEDTSEEDTSEEDTSEEDTSEDDTSEEEEI